MGTGRLCLFAFFGEGEIEDMDERELSCAFSDTLREDFRDGVSEIAEVGLDSIMNDGILKEIPFFSTAITVYKIGHSIKDRNNIKKMAVFFNEINKGIVSEEKRIGYQEKIRQNEKFRNQEIEYLLVLIDRYVGYDKPKMLAKLFMVYLEDTITWCEMAMYSEVIDRFILSDFDTLMASSGEVVIHENIGNESILRLIALGLMVETTNNSPFKEHAGGNIGITWEALTQSQSGDRTYKRTEFGEKLASILC